MFISSEITKTNFEGCLLVAKANDAPDLPPLDQPTEYSYLAT